MGKKIIRSPDNNLSSDFSLTFVHARMHMAWNPFHDGLSTESPPKEKESNIALCGGTEKGEQHRKKI